jgi:hypothetical protein
MFFAVVLRFVSAPVLQHFVTPECTQVHIKLQKLLQAYNYVVHFRSYKRREISAYVSAAVKYGNTTETIAHIQRCGVNADSSTAWLLSLDHFSRLPQLLGMV